MLPLYISVPFFESVLTRAYPTKRPLGVGATIDVVTEENQR